MGPASASTVPKWVAPTGSWASSEPIRRTMLGCRSRDTRPELALRSAVHMLGLRYRVAVSPIPGVRRTADIVFRSARVAVFLDGCFWHGCKDHFVLPKTNPNYWREKIDANRRRDADTDRKLIEAGWAVVRVWEHEDPLEAALGVHPLVKARSSGP